MRVNRGFLAAFVDRFKVDADDGWLRARMTCTNVPTIGDHEDPAMLLRALQINFERIYIPTDEGVRIGKWMYSLARGFVAYRYQSPQEYVDICMSPIGSAGLLMPVGTNVFAPDTVPIYAVDGLPGAGKSALFRALKHVFPPPTELVAEGNPPQRIGTVSALWVSVTTTFSVKNWINSTLIELGVNLSQHKGLRTIESLSALLFKVLYRIGVGMLIVDELQFASGRTSSRRLLSQLLAMREFGVPIIFFANTDLLANIAQSPAQISQRIPRDRRTLLPFLRNESAFVTILEAQLNLVPFGHAIDVKRESVNIYDMVAGSPRASARLIELGSITSVPNKRKLTLQDLVEAKRSSGFDSIREHISILTATAPVDVTRHPELASNNDQFDAAVAYRKQMEDQRTEDAAAVVLYASRSEADRETARAVEAKILRDAGKIPPNVTAVGESKRDRKQKATADQILKSSYAAKRLAKFPPQNPTDRDKGNSSK